MKTEERNGIVRFGVFWGSILGLVVLLGVAGFSGCPSPNPTPVPTPTPTPVPNPATCAGACAQGLSLGCPWASQTPSGKTCEQVCADTAAIVPWNVDCIAKAATCVAADVCQKR